jgi:hypothetical protein
VLDVRIGQPGELRERILEEELRPLALGERVDRLLGEVEGPVRDAVERLGGLDLEETERLTSGIFG